MTRLATEEDRWLRPGLHDQLTTELVWRNRRLSAKRGAWPVGALQMCEHLDAVHPGWTVYWQPENTIRGWEHPAGYRARRDTGHVSVCGVDPAALVAAMRRAPDERHWHYESRCCELVPIGRTF